MPRSRRSTTKRCSEAPVNGGDGFSNVRWNALNAVSYHSMVLGVTFFR
jgi:hypothetical protein